MGKLRKAREGKIIASSEASYGFTYTADRSGYIVDEREMVVLRRIFRMVGVEGKSLSAVKVILDREQVPTPGGARFWTRATLRALILDDVYKPHERVDIEELVTEGILSPEVASRLEESRRYGIWWYNRRRILEKGISEVGKDGRIYRRRRKTSLKPREEWIAVPVPDAGLEREVVEAAREAIRHNRKTSNAGHRFWELSGGISQCAECGRRMVTSVSTGRRGKRYFYYVCPRNYEQRWGACSSTKCHRAGDLEGYVWSLVSGLLKDPEHLRIGLERAIADERRSCGADPEVQERLWLDKLAEVDRKRSGFQDMAAEGLITFEELRAKLASLEETRETVKTELEVLRSGAERAAELERDKDALLDRLAAKAPERIDHATPEERHQIYNVLRLSVSVRADGALEVTGAFTDVLDSENTSRSTSKSIASPSRTSTQMRNAS